MYDLTDLQSYQDYFELLATQHKLIDNFAYGDQDVQNNEIRHWKGRRLWLWPYGPVRVEDNRSDNYMKHKEGSLFVGGVASSAKFSDENDYLKVCERICEDLISRILKDRGEGLLVTILNGYSYERVVLQHSSKIIGVELRFNFYDPTGFEYDETQWEE